MRQHACTPLIETDRLRLRYLNEEDAPFILELLNDPAFIKYIVDKGVRTVDQARDYITTGPVASYRKNGFGLYLTELKETGAPIGMCGLVRRPGLDYPDIGYAFMPEHCAKGYATESAQAVLDYGRNELKLDKIVAIISPGNQASARVLEKIGLKFIYEFRLEGYDTDTCYYA
ncbi:GNAT family N-acetyltransferase [Kiloniella laminariae]|uniref:GNAT family N-acetyltransferase n=1 Tax=Kiloniella laminariae TaxID=454162 RepID=A0ABT4LL70_9PROT|nr:GNAT family N-acetyltransferase [Kiloniella laminariae]MCZ4281848.1 GNAT family N-acetyltransferase [Kiloniella laminariae]